MTNLVWNQLPTGHHSLQRHSSKNDYDDDDDDILNDYWTTPLTTNGILLAL